MTAPGGGQTQSDPSGWSTDTLHEYVQTQFTALGVLIDHRFEAMQAMLDERHTAQKEAIAAALNSAEKAVNKAENYANKRSDEQNEFRGQLKDQAATFITRSETTALITAQSEKLDALSTRIDRSEGHGAGLNAGWVYLLAAVGALGTIISIIVVVQTSR